MPYKGDAARKYQRTRYRYARNILARYKCMRGCDICGYNTHAEALEFHHLRAKTRRVSAMMLYSKKRIKEEISKCELLCANCHRVETKRLWRSW